MAMIATNSKMTPMTANTMSRVFLEPGDVSDGDVSFGSLALDDLDGWLGIVGSSVVTTGRSFGSLALDDLDGWLGIVGSSVVTTGRWKWRRGSLVRLFTFH